MRRLHARRQRSSPLRPLLLASAVLSLGACSIIPIPIPLPGGARPTPIADRPIDLDGVCVQTEDDGFHEDARLRVRDNQVTALAWQMQIGRRGTCRFDQADFRQTHRRFCPPAD